MHPPARLLAVLLVALATGAGVPPTTSAPPAAAATAPIYGTGIAIDAKANIPIGPWPKVAHRFKARTSSALTSIRFSQRGGTGYSAGTGGTLQLTVQSDDGSGRPSGNVLASLSVKPGNPGGSWTTYHRHTFTRPATLVAGRRYHIVFRNTDPSPRSNYISVNNVAVLGGTSSPRQAAFADSDFAVLSTQRGSWAVESAYTAVMDLTYANGKHDGQGYIEAMVAKYGVISGTAHRVRERFKVSGSDRTISTISVRVRRTGGSAPLTIRLETAGGTHKGTVTIPASSVPLSKAGGVGGEVWVTARFATSQTLRSGQTYHLRLSTDAGTSYATTPLREGTDSGFESRRYTDGHAQRTTDGGATWTSLYQWSPVDLQFYFR